MMRRFALIAGVLLFAVLTIAVPQQSTRAAASMVASASELIAAINSANATPATADAIVLTASITLTAANETDADYGTTGLPAITSTILIDGQGFGISRSDSGPAFRILRVAAGGSLGLFNLSLSNGSGSEGNLCGEACGGGVLNEGTLTISNALVSGGHTTSGAGVYNAGSGSTTISDSTFTNNTAESGGGGLFNSSSGLVTITDSRFTSNTAESGAGVYNSSFSNLTLTGTTFSGNTTSLDGGAVYALGPISISGSTFSANSAQGLGGALFNNSPVPLTIDNSTFSGNTSHDDGGAIFNVVATISISNSTFSGNGSSALGGAISNSFSSNMTVVNTIIANSTSGGNCSDTSGGLFTSTFSLADDFTCPDFTLSNTINLGALANNGGTVQTIGLNAGSAALDAASLASCGTADPRGVKRGLDANSTPNSPASGDCDVGAFEAGGNFHTLEFAQPDSSLIATSINPFPVTLKLDAPLEAGYAPITVYVRASGGTAVPGTDYAAFGVQPVTFNPGDSSKTLLLNLLNAPLTSEKTIILSFATQNGPGLSGAAQFGTQLSHTVTLKVTTNTVPELNYMTTGTPTLTWTAIYGAVGYEIQVDTDTAFLPTYSYSDSNLSATTFSISIPLDNGVYYWRVRAKTTSGFGAWSPVQRLEVYVP